MASARFAEIGDIRLGLAARSDLAHAYRRGGRLDEAEALYRETISGWVHLGHRGAVANQLENIAYLAIERDRPERAARLLGAAEAMREAADAAMAFDEAPELARVHRAAADDASARGVRGGLGGGPGPVLRRRGRGGAGR